MNCEFCGKEEPLPFVCNYCGGVYCADHRLPEAHQCKGDLNQRRTISAPPQTTYTGSNMASTLFTPQGMASGKKFSVVEVRDIAIAWFGLGLAFFISYASQTVGLLNLGSAILRPPVATQLGEFFLVALVTVGSGFVLHELSHKFTAQRYGYWAEFRMWPFGLILALLTSLIGFIFAAPGATYINGMNITESENGKISLAGPLTNVGVALLFLPFFLFGTSNFLILLGSEGVFINVFLALFNMIPILPLDGAKVFRWSKVRWGSVFIPLALVFLFFLIP